MAELTARPTALSWPARDGPGRRLMETGLLLALDLGAMLAAAAAAYGVRVGLLTHYTHLFPPGLPSEMPSHAWWVAGTLLLVFARLGLYVKRQSYWREFETVVTGLAVAFLVVLAVVSLGQLVYEVSRTFLTLTWLFLVITVPFFRWAGKRWLARAGLWRRSVLVVGGGSTGRLVATAIAHDVFLGYHVVGFLGDGSAERNGSLPGGPAGEARWLGPLAAAEKVMASTGARTVIVASPHTPGADLVRLVNRLHQSADAVLIVPDLPGIPVLGVETEHFFDHQLLLLRVKNNLSSPTNRALKRLFDFAGGLVLLLLASPVFLLAALAIKIDSPGPVFFGHERVGRGKRLFRCRKFRTMVEDAQGGLAGLLEKDPELRREWAEDFKLRNDPRVTRVGKLLRRTSLDELPQLINVLAGQMSLVGPRPIVREEMERFGDSLATYLWVRPGVTGLWQVSGRTETDYQRRVDLEAWYVRNWTLWLDITILLQTVSAVLRRRGAY